VVVVIDSTLLHFGRSWSGPWRRAGTPLSARAQTSGIHAQIGRHDFCFGLRISSATPGSPGAFRRYSCTPPVNGTVNLKLLQGGTRKPAVTW
jgi:hypothetical protein